jgi:pyruvate/2-oxoglutarate dehydrogenase complex dihydrolipoamide acyltransferase (E2) component
MPTNVLVPRLGEGVEEVTVTKWLKAVGESVNELEPLLEVNTDKVDTEIPAPVSGVVLQVLMAEGVVGKVGELLAVIGQADEVISEQSLVTSGQSAKVQSSKVESQKSAEKEMFDIRPLMPKDLGFISPVVAKIAAEQGVDLQQVTGTGLGGRITKNDVLAFVEKWTTDHRPQTVVDTPATVHHPSATVVAPAPAPNLTSDTKTPDTLIKHTTMRKSIAAHMLESKRIAPHVLTVMEVDISRVVAHRLANKAAFERDGAKLTFTAYFMSAIVAGLKAYPLVNSSWSDEGVVVHGALNLGMATSLGEEGLIVPVIKGADGLSLLGMARAINDLAARARAKKLQPDEVRGGTFTLTNHGVSGSLFAMPIINQPQCGILGIGALQKRAVVVTDSFGNDSIAIRPMVYLSFVFDHRILDGASADWFLSKVKSTLENWGN